jgi:hypothetical protein
MMRRFLALAAILGVLSCADPVSPSSDILRINVLPDALELVNLSPVPVYFFAVESETLARINWAPCTEPACTNVGPGVKFVLPYVDMIGYGQGAEEAVVHHWHLIPGSTATGFRPDSIRATIVHLHVH